MLHNNLDPEVAEHPDDLVVYGGTGQAARDWPSFYAIESALRSLEDDETLLVQSGRPVGVFRTHEWAPRVLIANANLVPEWANWDEFRRLERLGLTMYGQMTAGSWIYIGTQGILQGTYETFAAIADKRFDGSLVGTLTVTCGAGGMGGAQPLAVTMNGGVVLCCDVDPSRVERRLQTSYLDTVAHDLDEALALAEEARLEARPLSIGLVGNGAEVVPELVRRDVAVDIATDQTPAHDPLSYVPAGMSLAEASELRVANPEEYVKQARASMAGHCAALVDLLDEGTEVFDYGNSLRAEARLGGFERAFDYPGFVPAYIRPLFCEGKGPFRWAALSGDPQDIAATDAAVLELFPDNDRLRRWLSMAGEKVAFQGLPARICWLGYGERDRAGLRFNEMVADGRLKAPVVIGRDHLDCGSVASPYRETEQMLDGSDAIADWPLLNALLNTASGASWVSIHDGGGVGIGRSIHAGQVSVADGSALAAEKLARVLDERPRDGHHPPRRRWLRTGRPGGRRTGRHHTNEVRPDRRRANRAAAGPGAPREPPCRPCRHLPPRHDCGPGCGRCSPKGPGWSCRPRRSRPWPLPAAWSKNWPLRPSRRMASRPGSALWPPVTYRRNCAPGSRPVSSAPHSAGIGEPVETEVVRALMLLRLKTLASGYTGARPVVAHHLAALLNSGVTPVVPSSGSLGCSGDLAPLAHCALVLMGEGEAIGPDGQHLSGSSALAAAELEPLVLEVKEGLALINGTDGMLGMLVLACQDLGRLCTTADVVGAMSVEALLGTDQAFLPELQALRPHPGQAVSAANMLRVLESSQIVASHREGDTRVQDAYSLRCAPQVTGAVRDTLAHARVVADRELAAAIDNPVVLEDGRVRSNGNFHGAPLAYVLDFLAIVAADLASISERRTDRLLDPARSHGLPPFLAEDAGVDSGLMLAQYAQASLVSQSKRLAVPASVDSVPTSAMQEDHVSMGWDAARKLRATLGHLTDVLAVELVAAARAIELRAPLRPAPATAAVIGALRQWVPGPDRLRLPRARSGQSVRRLRSSYRGGGKSNRRPRVTSSDRPPPSARV